MVSLNFPNTPTIGDQFTNGAQSWQWDGISWNLIPTIVTLSRDYTINPQAGTTYTLVLSDDGKLLTTSNASPVTITVPPNSVVPFPIGTYIPIISMGVGLTTVAQGAGVTVLGTPSLTLRAQNSRATLFKVGTDLWYLVDDLSDPNPYTKVDVYDANGTWTKPSWATSVNISAISAGGGGASGRRGAAGTVRSGGGGGAGGSWSFIDYAASDLPSTLTISVSAGGAGGVAVTTDDTNGNAGSIGFTSRAANGATVYLQSAGAASNSGVGGTATTASGGAVGLNGMIPGGAAGSGGAGLGGGGSQGAVAGGGGGAGGGISAANAVFDGGAGGYFSGRLANGPTGGTAGGAGQTHITAGGPVPSLTLLPFSGGGGGASSIVAAAGAGGAGAGSGGGGGGGGASLNGFASGAGGAGGNGRIVIISRR